MKYGIQSNDGRWVVGVDVSGGLDLTYQERFAHTFASHTAASEVLDQYASRKSLSGVLALAVMPLRDHSANGITVSPEVRRFNKIVENADRITLGLCDRMAPEQLAKFLAERCSCACLPELYEAGQAIGYFVTKESRPEFWPAGYFTK